jgi:acetyl-CoA acetyltransferase
VTVPPVRYSNDAAPAWVARALRALCRAAGVRHTELDGFSLASFSIVPDTAVGLVQHLGLTPRWLDQIVTGGASGVCALRRAARAVQAGDAEMVACVAADANRIDSFRRMLGSFSRFAMDASYPYGGGGPNMAFALLTDRYMRAHGATREDFARIAVAQRACANATPGAIMGDRPLTVEDYIGARMISDPVCLFDCVMPVAGAEAFLVTTPERAAALGLPPVRIAATIERHGAHAGDDVQGRGGWTVDVDALWDAAGCGPGDVDLVQTYDDYPVISMMQIEGLGFAPEGGAADFLRGRDMTAGGDFPHNVSGGQLSFGQAGAAGGYLGLTEALRQVTGTAANQVPGARRALVSGFGVIAYDRGVATAAAVLEAA